MTERIQQTVVHLIANALFDANYAVPAVSDSETVESIPTDETFWKGVMKECGAQAVSAVAASALPGSENDGSYAKVYTRWNRLQIACVAQNARVMHMHREIHDLMVHNAIPYVILKGCASAAYYPKPNLRALGDVDFLVKPEDVDRAWGVLENAGFLCTHPDKDAHHHIVFSKDGIAVEMHFSFNGIPEGKAGERVTQYLRNVIECAHPDPKTGLIFPSELHHALIVLLHNARHMCSDGMGLRHLSDWAVFAHHLNDRYGDVLEKALKETGLWTYACVLTNTCRYGLGMPLPATCDTVDDSLCEAMLYDSCYCGNFGYKEQNKATYMFLHDTNGQVSSRGVIGNFIDRLSIAARTHFPVVKRVPILYPIGWIVAVARYLILLMTGRRRSLNATDTLQTAHRRNELYRRLNLFEVHNK